MILNLNNCQYMCIRKNNERYKLIVCLDRSKKEVRLGITIDSNLNFDSHIKRVCPKSVPKLSGLLRISHTLEWMKKNYCL